MWCVKHPGPKLNNWSESWVLGPGLKSRACSWRRLNELTHEKRGSETDPRECNETIVRKCPFRGSLCQKLEPPPGGTLFFRSLSVSPRPRNDGNRLQRSKVYATV